MAVAGGCDAAKTSVRRCCRKPFVIASSSGPWSFSQPPYDRRRWDAVVFEYGEKREFRRNLWVVNPEAYYAHLMAANYRSTAGRYNQLNDDIRNDVVRIPPFFDMARRVIDTDRKRQATMDVLTDISPAERLNALARIAENNLTIAWVEASLSQLAPVIALPSIASWSLSQKASRPTSTFRSHYCRRRRLSGTCLD
jgi:hypothetical protein